MECAKDKFEDTKQIKFDCLILFQTQIWKSENKTSYIVKTAETKFNRTIEFLFSFAPKFCMVKLCFVSNFSSIHH